MHGGHRTRRWHLRTSLRKATSCLGLGLLRSREYSTAWYYNSLARLMTTTLVVVVVAAVLHRASGDVAECPENCAELASGTLPAGLVLDQSSCAVDGRWVVYPGPFHPAPPGPGPGGAGNAVPGKGRSHLHHPSSYVPYPAPSSPPAFLAGMSKNKHSTLVFLLPPGLLQVAQLHGAQLQLQRPARRRV